jgi:hypothetical protein
MGPRNSRAYCLPVFEFVLMAQLNQVAVLSQEIHPLFHVLFPASYPLSLSVFCLHAFHS